MDAILILMSWLILLVPGFDDSVPVTSDKIFKIETSPDIIQSITTRSDETMDFLGFDIELKQNSARILEIKVPKNLPTPASFTTSWHHGENPIVLTDGAEIDYDIISDPCFSHYRIPVEDKTNLEILYPVILTGSWQLYSPIQFDESHQCYNNVFYEKSLEPPLKQFKSDVSVDEIQCKDGLVLIKKHDGSPACVSELTKQKLIERGWTKNIKKSLSDVEPEFLSKTITEWKSMPRKQLMDYYDDYSGGFFSDLGKFMIKDEMMHEMKRHGIQNKYDDFAVFGGLTLTSLPPHIGFSAVVNATDQKTYLLGGSVFGNTIESVHLRELVFYEHVLNPVDGKNMEHPYEKLLKTEPQVSISEDSERVRLSPHTAILDLEQRRSVAFHNKLEYPIRIEAYIPDSMDTILKSGTISPNQTDIITFENIGMYEYDVLGYPDNNFGLWDKKEEGEIVVISEETENLQLEEKLEIARSFLYHAKDDIPYYSISTGNGNGELSVGLIPAVEKSIPDYQEYYEKRIQQWIPFEIPIDVE